MPKITTSNKTNEELILLKQVKTLDEKISHDESLIRWQRDLLVAERSDLLSRVKRIDVCMRLLGFDPD